jgi:hypothetical protein
MKSPEFEFAPSDKIDTRSFEILEKAFGVRPGKIIFISDGTVLEEVEEISRGADYDFKNPPSGHKLVKVTEIPPDDVLLYEGDLTNEKRHVWYPPFSEKEIRRLSVRARISAVRKVEKAYGIKMKELKSIDKHPELLLTDVASYIDSFKLSQLLTGENFPTY